MKNKKAFLAVETIIKIIVAVVCIFFLIFLVGLVYGSFIKNQELEQAKSSLNLINNRINSIKEGESESFLVESPAGWKIVNWPNFDLGYSKPEQCERDYEKDCLCICKEASIEECNKKAACVDLNKNFLIDIDIEIEAPTALNLTLKDNKLILEKLK